MTDAKATNTDTVQQLMDQFSQVLDFTFAGLYDFLHHDPLVSMATFMQQTEANEDEVRAAIGAGALVAHESEEFGTLLHESQIHQWKDQRTQDEKNQTEPFLHLDDLTTFYKIPLGLLDWTGNDLIQFSLMGLLISWQHPKTKTFYIEEKSFISFMEYTITVKKRQNGYQSTLDEMQAISQQLEKGF